MIHPKRKCVSIAGEHMLSNELTPKLGDLAFAQPGSDAEIPNGPVRRLGLCRELKQELNRSRGYAVGVRQFGRLSLIEDRPVVFRSEPQVHVPRIIGEAKTGFNELLARRGRDVTSQHEPSACRLRSPVIPNVSIRDRAADDGIHGTAVEVGLFDQGGESVPAPRRYDFENPVIFVFGVIGQLNEAEVADERESSKMREGGCHIGFGTHFCPLL